MRQVQLDQYGGPDVLHLVTAPDPVPGAGEVLLHVEVAGTTFVETQLRAGRPPWPGPLPALPLVLGNGVAGTIAAVGAGVDDSWLGLRVVTATGGSRGYADRVVVPASDPVAIPEGISSDIAVTLLADGRTALALVRAAALTASDRVIVLAAAGGVGSLLVQLVRSAGVQLVVAAAGSAAKLQSATTLGANVTVNYSEPGWSQRLRNEHGPVDVIFDAVGGALADAAFGAAKEGARVLLFGGASGSMTKPDTDLTQRFSVVRLPELIRSASDNRNLIERALAASKAGELRPVIGNHVPLERAAEAHAAMEARNTVGKTLLAMST